MPQFLLQRLLPLCALVVAAGALTITGGLLLPGEWQRVRRFGGASAGGRAPRRPLLRSDRARGGPLSSLSALLAARDDSLLAAAGLADHQVALYSVMRPLAPVVAAVIALLCSLGRATLPATVVAAVGAAILLPEVWLRWLIGRRRARIAREFPEFVDLLVIAAGGGAALADALRLAAADDRTALAGELRRALRESAAGAPLASALRQTARHVGLPGLSAFIGSLCEAESLGVPLADTLGTQAESARTAYRQLLEGRVNQLPLQMTICALVFLFPMAFIVVALPNIIAFTNSMR